MSKTYTTRTEAIEFEIEQPINAGEADARDYDMEMIADQLLTVTEDGRYTVDADAPDFWDLAADARFSYYVTVTYSQDGNEGATESLTVDSWGLATHDGVKTLAASPAGFTHTLAKAGDVYADITALVAEATGYTLELTGEWAAYSWAGHSESWLVELTR